MTEQKKNKIKELRNYLSKLNPEQRQAIASKYGFLSVEGHSYSIVNQLLIAFQRPDSTILGGYQQFRKAGRQVKQGEHGITIFFPSVKKSDDDIESDDQDVRFYCATIFDISQTYEIGK